MTQIYHQLPPDFVQAFLQAALITWRAVSPSPQISRKFTLTTVLTLNRVRTSPTHVALSAKKLRNQLTTPPYHNRLRIVNLSAAPDRSDYRMDFQRINDANAAVQVTNFTLYIHHARQLLHCHNEISDRSYIHS